MTMTPEEKLTTALQLAEEVVSAANIVSHDGYYELDIDAVTVVLSEAIDRMQERVRAETERLQPPADVFDTAFVLQQIGRQATNTDVRQVAAWVLSTAIRETPHAEG